VGRTETLIGCYVLTEKYFNTKFSGVIHGGVALLLAVISLYSNLVFEFYRSLSKEWSVTIQKEEQRLYTFSKVTKFVGAK